MSTTASESGDTRFEQVHVELDWYDGPRLGLADVDGVPHYFAAVNDYNRGDQHDDHFMVWPTDQRTLESERRQWRLFVAWNDLHEAGKATVDQHPGHRGVNSEYDQLTDELEQGRTPSPGSRVLHATWQPLNRGKRYAAEGPSYRVRWHDPTAT